MGEEEEGREGEEEQGAVVDDRLLSFVLFSVLIQDLIEEMFSILKSPFPLSSRLQSSKIQITFENHFCTFLNLLKTLPISSSSSSSNQNDESEGGGMVGREPFDFRNFIGIHRCYLLHFIQTFLLERRNGHVWGF